MAQEYIYPKWIQDAWLKGNFNINQETGSYKYSNPKYNKNYKFEFNPKLDHSDIKRGDLICFGERTYRNENVWIWNGNKIEPLCTDIDDYGSVPPDYKVGKDFPPDFWIGKIDHNSIIWLDEETINKIEFIKKEGNTLLATVVIRDEEYKITFWMSDASLDNLNKYIYNKSLKCIVNDKNEILAINKETTINKFYSVKILFPGSDFRKEIKEQNPIIDYDEKYERYFILIDNKKYFVELSKYEIDEVSLINEVKEILEKHEPPFNLIDELTLECYL